MESVQSRVSSVTKYLRIKTLMQPTVENRELEIQDNLAGNEFTENQNGTSPAMLVDNAM